MDECLFRSKDELNNPLLILVKEEQNEKKWSRNKMHCVVGIASGAIVKRTHVAKANVNNTSHFFHPSHPPASIFLYPSTFHFFDESVACTVATGQKERTRSRRLAFVEMYLCRTTDRLQLYST